MLLIGSGLGSTGVPDSEAYRMVALRLLHGQPLYVPMNPDSVYVYRYAPWFAFAYVPFAVLPGGGLAWFALRVAAWVYLSYAAFHLGGHAGLVLGILAVAGLGSVPGGNVAVLAGALLVATRMNPVAVGLFASLKVYPILLAAGYVAERRWRDLALALGTATALWIPALWFGLSGYMTSPGSGGISLWAYSPDLWMLQDLLLVTAVGVLAWRRSRWTWLAAAALVPLAPPRVFPAGIAYFLAAGRRVADGRALSWGGVAGATGKRVARWRSAEGLRARKGPSRA